MVELADAYRRRVFFNYEKRIRLRSPPEKVFYRNSNPCCFSLFGFIYLFIYLFFLHLIKEDWIQVTSGVIIY